MSLIISPLDFSRLLSVGGAFMASHALLAHLRPLAARIRKEVKKMKDTIKAQASKYWVAATALALPMAAHAQSTAPLDMAATGTTIAGYVAAAAGAGLAILAARYGVRIIVSAFKSVK